MRENLKISGKIISNNKNDDKYIFILTNFTLYIKLIKCSEIVSGVTSYPQYVKSENGFIKGITDNNEYIYFAIGNRDIGIYSLRTINIDFYIKLDAGYNFEKGVDVIKFMGGTLNQFAKLNILEIPIKEENCLRIPYKDKNEVKIEMRNNIVDGLFIFRGSAKSNWTVDDGISVFEEDASLYIETPVSQKNIIDIFRYVSNIFKFFTFRNNVGGFDIVLMIKDEKNRYISVGECHYKNEEYYKSNKSANNCISIELFNPEQLSRIFDLLYIDESNEDNNSRVFSYDFLSDDKHSTLISKNNVKDTITAFECAERMLNVNYINGSDKKYDELKKKIDNVIDIENGLTEEDKNRCKKYIQNIGKRNKSVKDRIVSQYNKYKDCLDEFIKKYNIEMHDIEKEMDKLVKYRNKHTHNDIGILTQEIANSTYILQALVYCMILKEVNMSNEHIKYVISSCVC